MTDIKPQILPPTADMLKIAAKVNALIKPTALVNLFRRETPEGEEYGIVYSVGGCRRTVQRSVPFTEADVEDMARAAFQWATNMQAANRWTLDPNEAA